MSTSARTLQLSILFAASCMGASIETAFAQPPSNLTVTTSTRPASPLPGRLDHKETLDLLKRQVSALEQRIRTTQMTVENLKDAVVGGDPAETQFVLIHKNELGAAYRIEQVIYTLDGATVLRRVDPTGKISDQLEFEVFHGRLPAGDHEVSVTYVLRAMGVPADASSRFSVESKNLIRVLSGRVSTLIVRSYPKTEASLAVTDRVGVRYDFESVLVAPKAKSQAGANGSKDAKQN